MTKADELLDYKTVNSAIESLIPGEWSDYFKNHFRPFLEIPIQTGKEQRQALGNLLKYCDETTIKVPRIMKLAIRLAGGIAKDTRTAEEMTAYYRDMSEEQYQFFESEGLGRREAEIRFVSDTILFMSLSGKCKENSRAKDTMIFLSGI